MPTKLPPLPIDTIIPEIQSSIAAGHDIILKSSPGSGKTTRVPPALLNSVKGQIWVLEPRRIAARMSALRVASELNEAAGQTVGWQMRFEREFSDKTRILFLTEGMFLSRLSQNPNLIGVECVILDEFHERHQQTDVAFALCKHLQSTTRKDLRIIVMSATLDVMTVANKMPTAQVLELDLPLFPVTVKHDLIDTSQPIHERAAAATIALIKDPSHVGHILVFLPGTAEILKTRRSLEHCINQDNWVLLELRGTLDKKTQELAFQNTEKRKIVLATNIAESSITIPNVTAVVDTGIAKVPAFNSFTGLSMLETRPISKASIIQRSGRAGRTAAGMAVRLFSKHDEASRPDVDTPEILRLDLAQTYMALIWLSHQLGQPLHPEKLPWPNHPDPKQWEEARRLLQLLQIIDQDLQLLRPDVARMPLHPRLARFAAACVDHGLAAEAPWLTALLASPGDTPSNLGDNSHLGCDLLAMFETLRAKPGAFTTVEKTAVQIARYLDQKKLTPLSACNPAHELDLSKPLLKAFPDRVVLTRRRTGNSNYVDGTICTGGDLLITAASAAAHGQWLIAIDASSSRSTGSLASAGSQSSTSKIVVSQASMINPSDFPHAPASFLITETTANWDSSIGKTRHIKKTRYGILTVAETIVNTDEQDINQTTFDKGEQLAKILRQQWPKTFDNSDYFDSYIARQKLAFDKQLVDHCWDKQELMDLLIAFICDTAASLDDVKRHSLEEWLRFCVGEEEFQYLQKIAPTHITVGRNHKVQVNYPSDSQPWVEARLQNFFGQSKTPTILNGTLSLTVHLLAPNMRALQVTTDLASFWQGAYKSIRNEYQRKYPRHPWPEDPINAEPPAPKPGKPRR
jgi:ATP-dependent helicase HrpB